MSKLFQYKSYNNCYFQCRGHYMDNTPCIEIWNNMYGCIATVTVCIDVGLNSKYKDIDGVFVAIKSYSENEGMLEFLKDNGFIKPEPDVIDYVDIGFVRVPIVVLSDKMLDYVDINR